MKAVVLHEYGGPGKLKYEEWEDPQAGDGQILIRVTAAGINPIDWKIRSGAMKAFMPIELPAILGYDYSGIVCSVGKGVEGFAAGDKVFGRADKAYAELLLGDLAGMSKLPDGLDQVEAAALPVVRHQPIPAPGGYSLTPPCRNSPTFRPANLATLVRRSATKAGNPSVTFTARRAVIVPKSKRGHASIA
jgi:hypothetical protein